MSSRSSAGAIVFVVAIVGIGLLAAYRAERKVPDAAGSAPPSASVGDTADAVATTPIAPARDEAGASSGAAPATAEAPPAAEPEAADTASGTPDPAPPAQSASIAPAPASPAQGARTAAAPDTASGKPGDADSASEDAAPTYDLVRVEPTGDAVIAGRAGAGATVELEANSKVVGSTVANDSGEWVIVLDQPLAPGDYDIALRASAKNAKAPTTSNDRLAVSIPANRTETPMVALSRPNAPIQVLQKPAATIEPPATQVAAAEPSPPAGGTDAAASADVAASGHPAPASAADGAPASSGPAQASGTAAGRDGGADRPNAGEEAPAAPKVAAPAAEAPAPPAAAAESGAAAGAVSTADAPSAAPSGATAGQKAPTPQDAVPVTIEIAEAEGNTFRLQGTSKPGADIWVYLAGEYIGEAHATDAGRWSFEATMDFEEGDYSIRVDQVANRAGAVATRAEVPFAFKRAGKGPAVAAGDTKVAVLGETEDGVRVLIRRGDNLWTIAHHFYGDGFSYANIYRENNGQIRNPHLIYPGQVFVMPGLTKKDIGDAAKGRAL
ncbi:LysM peptidoglycan-binding domain-containing protein [Amorphus sp. MBR-141]